MPRGGPHGGRAQDSGVNTHYIHALLHHDLPPGVLYVAQHIYAQGAVIVGGAESAVNLRRLEDKSPPLGEIRYFVEQFGVLNGSVGHPSRLPELGRAFKSNDGLIRDQSSFWPQHHSSFFNPQEVLNLVERIEGLSWHAPTGAKRQSVTLKVLSGNV